ncbi:polysaccharide deacetylase [Chryseobacterium sp. VAUSW3]|uniref:polysaccharide deacetylase n=1 Tax=Chryseobacterium sp. VAUSW3 TaxID=2010998 RepID=UPI000B4D49D5|nr:polysaccharide deacetylase [Chryseobacterium sp. VAUSW3]OWR14364.1 polysaccharide deacetylase [Chryseobacterium sp. VAUSW3]
MILLTFNIINNKRDFKNNYRLNDGEITEITIDNVSSVLRILGNNNILATFFIEISLVVTLQPLIKKIISKGHEIALYNADSNITEIETAKQLTEAFTEKLIRGIRQKEVNLSVDALKKLEFSYISNIENANILFPLKRLQRSTEIIEENGVSIIPESISPYSQIPYNDFVFQMVPLKFYQNMVTETLKNEDFILIYLNSWQFTDFEKYQFKIPFYRKYNSGRKMEDKLEHFLQWCNTNELACARMKDFIF